MPKRDIHVVPRDGGWAARREAAGRDSSHHDRKSGAINAARGTARSERVEVVEPGRDSRTRNSERYGRDPFPPRDNKR